ncbi:MAG: YbfB/YjiJ family MFS transporter [Rhizobiaceae bacterium]
MTAPASPMRLALGGMIAMAVAMGIGRFVYTPILPGMMEGLDLSASDAGLIASANYLGYLIGAVLASGAWGQGRERLVMLAGLGASAVLAALMGLTEGMVAFVIIRFLAGVASAFLMVFLSTIVFTQLAAAGRDELQAMHFGGVGMGIAVSSLMTGALVLANAEWQASWLWAGGLSALGFVATFLLVDRGPAVSGPAKSEPPLPKSRRLARVIIAYGLFGFGYVVTATFLVAIVRQGDGGRMFESAVWLVTGLSGLVSVWLWNKSVRRIGLAKTFAIGCLVEAVGVAASVSIGGYAGPLIAAVLLGGTFIAVTAQGLQAARRLAGDAPRRALGLMTASFGTGQIIGPIVAGYLADRAGNFVSGSAVAVIMLLASAAIMPRDTKTR